MNSSKGAFALAVVAVIIAIAGFVYHPATPSYGEIGTRWPNGIYIGSIASNASKVSTMGFGTCSLIASSYTLAASTSLPFDCAVPTAVTGDAVDAWFATSTSAGAGWLVTQSSASTTSGFITIDVVNNTGASAVIPASIASTTKYIDLR